MKLLMSALVLGGMAFLLTLRVDQPEYGTIHGIVANETGSPIADARIAARHGARSLTFRATTDKTGTYRLSALPPGRYSIVAEAPKHHTRVVYGVILNRNEELRVDIILPCCVELPSEASHEVTSLTLDR